MKKLVLSVFFLGLCSTGAFAQSKGKGGPKGPPGGPPSFSMPEPSGMVELATCVAVGLGAFALRRRK